MANNIEEITLHVSENSPYVIGARAYVEQTENGAVITIVDKEGTTTATVTNGRGIVSATLNADYTLTLVYTDGTSVTTSSIRGATGESGVYCGSEEPSNPDVDVWIDPTGDPYPMEDEIAEAVDDWITAHPEYVTTVQDGAITVPKFAAGVVDTALNKTGYPADSKATGDAITADRTRLTAVEGEADALDARITSLATLTEGSTTGDAELIDARTVGSTTYASLHQAIDTEFSNVKSASNDFNKNVIGKENYLYGISVTSNAYINDSGVITSSNGFFYTDLIALPSGKYSLWFASSNGATARRIHGYKNGTWVKMIAKDAGATNNGNWIFEIDNNEIDAIRISGNKAILTLKSLTRGDKSVESEIADDSVYNAAIRKYAFGTEEYLRNIKIVSGAYIDDSGTITSSNGFFYTDLISLPTGRFNLVFSSTSDGTFYRIHGYKNGTWVKMIAKDASVSDYSTLQFAIDNAEVDAVRLSGNVAITTFHYLFTADTGVTEDTSKFYSGSYKCMPCDFDDWYKCLATDAELDSYAFSREKSYADTIALFDTLVDNKYVTKNLMTHLDDLNIDIYEYVFKPKIYTRSPLTADGLALHRATPKILLDAGMHGFEKGGVFANFLFLRDLIHHWEDNKSLENIKNYVEIHCNPIVNPYGFTNNVYYNENEVNINRNFGSSTWAYHEPGTQGSGDAPFDQAETQMIVNWVSANNDALAYIDHHTNGQYYAVEPLGLNLCYLPSADYGDNYSRRWYNVVNRHIEKQTLMYPREFPDVDFHLENSTTQNSYLGRYQQTTHTGTVDVWSLENATVPAMTLECINGWKSSSAIPNDDAEIPLFSNTAMRIGAENVGNFICQLLQEFCD